MQLKLIVTTISPKNIYICKFQFAKTHYLSLAVENKYTSNN